jgi:hypothetical protein
MNEFRVTTERYPGWDEAEIKGRVSLELPRTRPLLR